MGSNISEEKKLKFYQKERDAKEIIYNEVIDDYNYFFTVDMDTIKNGSSEPEKFIFSYNDYKYEQVQENL